MKLTRRHASAFSTASATALAVVTGACDSQPRVQRSQVGDTVVVSTRLTRVDTAQLEVAARLALPASRDTSQHAVTALAVSPDGRVYAATDDGRIHRFGAQGVESSFPVTSDSSPKMHSTIQALLVDSLGGVLARESNGTIHRFSAQGTQTGSWMAGSASGLTAAQLLAQTRGGEVRVGLAATPTDTVRRATVPILASWAAPDVLRDTVYAPGPLLKECGPFANAHFRSGSFADIRKRYLPSLQWAPLSTGGVVIGCNADYRLDLIDGRGHVTRITHEHTIVPVSAEENQSFVRAWTLRMRTTVLGPNWSWQGDSLPDRKPAYQRILTSSDGRIWIWPAQASRSIPAPAQWVLIGGPGSLWIEPTTGTFDVFAADGRFLGRVALRGELGYAPFGVTAAPVIRADTVWLVAVDSTGASALVRAHVRWPRARSLRVWARHASRALRFAMNNEETFVSNAQRGRIGTPTLLPMGGNAPAARSRLRTHVATPHSYYAQLNWQLR